MYEFESYLDKREGGMLRDLLHFRVLCFMLCFSLQEALLISVPLYSSCGSPHRGELRRKHT